MKRLSRRLLLAGLGLLAAGTIAPRPTLAQEAKLPVVATFSILGDFVERVGGDRVAVKTLVGPNGVAHVYEPTPTDAKAVAAAKLGFVNGIGPRQWRRPSWSSSTASASRAGWPASPRPPAPRRRSSPPPRASRRARWPTMITTKRRPRAPRRRATTTITPRRATITTTAASIRTPGSRSPTPRSTSATSATPSSSPIPPARRSTRPMRPNTSARSRRSRRR